MRKGKEGRTNREGGSARKVNRPREGGTIGNGKEKGGEIRKFVVSTFKRSRCEIEGTKRKGKRDAFSSGGCGTNGFRFIRGKCLIHFPKKGE